jgi:hypothetical protein
MADPYEEYQRRDFIYAEEEARLSDKLEAHADPVFHALAEGNLDPLIRYLREMGDMRSVPLSRALANHLADMLQVEGKSLFRLKIGGRATGERGREQRLRVSHRTWLIGYCAERLIEEVRGTKNAKWAKGVVGAEFGVGKTKVDESRQLVQRYSAKAKHRQVLNDRFSDEYGKRLGQHVKKLKPNPMPNE